MQHKREIKHPYIALICGLVIITNDNTKKREIDLSYLHCDPEVIDLYVIVRHKKV